METVSLIVGVILGILMGIAIGIFVAMNRMKQAVKDQSIGNLRIDRSEPDEPPMPFLEIYNGHTIEGISRKKFVMLKVVNEDYLARK